MAHRDLIKLIELEGQVFDEFMKQGKIEEAIGVIKRQLDLYEKHLVQRKKEK